MAGIAFPSYAYQNVAPFATQVVQSQAALTALGATWSTTPVVVPPSGSVPFDPGFVDTDTRLQQMLVELRTLNLQVNQAFSITEDPVTIMRPDVLANDSNLTS